MARSGVVGPDGVQGVADVLGELGVVGPELGAGVVGAEAAVDAEGAELEQGAVLVVGDLVTQGGGEVAVGDDDEHRQFFVSAPAVGPQSPAALAAGGGVGGDGADGGVDGPPELRFRAGQLLEPGHRSSSAVGGGGVVEGGLVGGGHRRDPRVEIGRVLGAPAPRGLLVAERRPASVEAVLAQGGRDGQREAHPGLGLLTTEPEGRDLPDGSVRRCRHRCDCSFSSAPSVAAASSWPSSGSGSSGWWSWPR